MTFKSVQKDHSGCELCINMPVHIEINISLCHIKVSVDKVAKTLRSCIRLLDLINYPLNYVERMC